MRNEELLPSNKRLWLILLPMLATVVGIRLYHHLLGVRHVYFAGYLVRHLFSGALLIIPAAFALAFGPRNRWLSLLALVALGAGSAMVLDEVVFLVVTRATDQDYVSRVSLGGSVVLNSLAVICLLILYRLKRD